MEKYKLILTRRYEVAVEAKNKDVAAKAVEVYIKSIDNSSLRERLNGKFRIKNIKLTYNFAW
jgi:short-subunit dehydrogenase